MNLQISDRDLMSLVFSQDDNLTAERSRYIRSPFYNLDPMFPRRVISSELAAALSGSTIAYIQRIELGDPVYILWFRGDWEESVTKRFDLVNKMQLVKTEHIKANFESARIYRMAQVMHKYSGAPVETFIAFIESSIKEKGEDGFRQSLSLLETAMNRKFYEPPVIKLAEEEKLPSEPQTRIVFVEPEENQETQSTDCPNSGQD